MNRSSVSGLLVCAALLVGNVLASSPPAPPAPSGMRSWSEVEAIEAAAERARQAPYRMMMGRLLLAPDGRAVVFGEGGDPDEGPRHAMLGRHARNGNLIELTIDGGAIDLSHLSAEARAEYEAQLAEYESAAVADGATVLHAEDEGYGDAVDAEDAATEDEADDVEATEDSDAAQDETDDEAGFVQRWLVVPYRGGELLLDFDSLKSIASAWDGEGHPLEVYATGWRPLDLVDPEHAFELEIDDPLRANLPFELARLLRPQAIETRIVALKQAPDTLRWKRNRALLELQLDRGERDGLYVDMDLYGVAPDDDLRATVTGFAEGRAIAKLELERFAPTDRVRIPAPGVRLTSRFDRSVGCAIDTSVALRGKVVAVRGADALRWKDGFAYLTLTLDQGSADGLMLGDRFSAEDDTFDGEGRVDALEPHAATVLWRLTRYGPGHAPTAPAVDAALVTPAWQRAAYDMFGETEATDVEVGDAAGTPETGHTPEDMFGVPEAGASD